MVEERSRDNAFKNTERWAVGRHELIKEIKTNYILGIRRCFLHL